MEIDKTLLQQLSRLHAPDCPSIGTLGEFLDGKLPPAERQSLEAHLQGCPACLNRLIDLRELAFLATEGEAPPPALREKLKRLARFQATGQEAGSSLWERTTAALAALWAAVWQWTSPRFIGEILAASAVAVFIVFISTPPVPQGTQEGSAVVKTLTELSTSEQSILQSLSAAPAGLDPLQKQIATTLEKLPKNLVLEETRGVSNVEVYKKAAPATVLVLTDKSLGSGAVISSQGEVLTNWHVLQGAKQLAVVFKPQRGVEIKEELAFAAIPLKVDQVTDLALLQIVAPPPNLSALPLGNMAEVEVGQDVHVIGHPEGEVWTYTTGIISQVRPAYQWTGVDGLLHQSKVIQTQTALNPGNSGGPLLNDRAELIGINSFRKEGEGLNYAVAVDVVKEFLRRAESRAAAPAPSPQATSYRMEPYGTNIIGVYINAQVPPPDVWLVYRDSRKQVAYAARRDKSVTQIDTVMQRDPESERVAYYFDLDCDGKIDLIGVDSNGDGTLDRYDLPREPFPLASLAPELAQAIQQGLIPYPQLRVCQ